MPDRIFLKRLPHGENLNPPQYATEGASGADLCAAVPEDAPMTIRPGERVLIPTGFAVEIPDSDVEIQIRPRSGNAFKHGVTVLNAPGTIDSDYRGEIKVLVANLGTENFIVRRGDRIAQAVIAPVLRAVFTVAENLNDTKRGEGGFGSTGISEILTEKS